MDALNYNFKRSPVSVAVVNITFKDSYKNFSRSSPVQNAVGNGTESRDILNFNGTQYATLSEPVVLDGDFEIEVTLYPATPDGTYFRMLSGGDGVSPSNFNSEADGRLGIAAGPGSYRVSTTTIERNKIQVISAKRIGTDIEIANRSTGSSTLSGYTDQFVFDRVGLNNSGVGSAGPFSGIFFSIRIWKNGDRNTGELVTDLRFDEPDTIHQRNYAVPVESGLLGNNLWSTPNDYSNGELLINTTDAVTVQGSPVDGGTRTAKHLDYTFSVGSTYKVSGRVTNGSETLVVYLREGASAGTGTVVGDSGVLSAGDAFEFLFTASSTDHNILVSKASAAEIGIEGLEIETFLGASLQNVLPDDWLVVSKKGSDNFWAGSNQVTQHVWENPFQVGDQWTFEPETNTWLYVGDGELNALQIIGSYDQHPSARITGKVHRLSGVGTFALTASSAQQELFTIGNDEFEATPVFEFDRVVTEAGGTQQYKRRGGVLSVRLYKPTYTAHFEYAEGAL